MKVGIDVGGTFTDLVVAEEDGVRVIKVPSTPSDPAVGFGHALDRAEAGAGPVSHVLHGTTVATNAVLTRSGARLAFCGTTGFADLLHLARQRRPSLYDPRVPPPEPLVARNRCVGVPERVAFDGAVLRPLDEEETRDVLRGLEGAVDGVVVVLLHAYANPEHERRVGELAREALPEATVSLSSDVLSEIREYERASTTALNAYVQPAVSRYLGRVRERTGGVPVGVMWSGGGVRSVEETARRPVHTLYSGPAAGVLGATWAAERCGVGDVVTLDMGGTSADVALVSGGRPLVAEEATLDGLPFRTPCLDVVSVGAGGGSVGWIDEGGALRVGPRSAGADPGPACYARGGEEATVTDAHVVGGHLGEEGLAGGELALDPDAAHRAIERLGAECGLGRDETAEGMLRVVRAAMGRAIRSVSVERGRDVRRYALVAFGGAGPLHAAAIARELGITRVLVPPAPGALAALGLLVAARRAEVSRSRPMIAEPRRDAELRSIVHELTEGALAELAHEGVGFADSRIELACDLRYEGQSHELRIPLERASFADLTAAFHDAHRERYGFAREGVPVEAVTFRAAASGPPGEVQTGAPRAGSDPGPVGSRRIGGRDVGVYRRGDLPAGWSAQGPLVVVELDATTYVEPGASLRVHETGTLILEVS